VTKVQGLIGFASANDETRAWPRYSILNSAARPRVLQSSMCSNGA